MASAWKAGDGTEFSHLFAGRHDFIIYNGYYSKDRTPQENASHQQYLFDHQFKNTIVYFTIDKIEYLSKDIALMHVLGAVTPTGAGRPEEPELLWTGILQKFSDTWKIKCLQLSRLDEVQNGNTISGVPDSPRSMYSSWYEAK